MLWTAVGVPGQTPTLVELAAQGEPVSIRRYIELNPVPLEILAQRADLIVHGTVTLKRTYLSDDQRELYTDYEVIPKQVVASSIAIETKKPGFQPLLVKQFGGRTVINGVPVELTHRNLPLMRDGSDVVLFLAFDETGKKYTIQDLSGAFIVTDGRVTPLLTPPVKYEQFRGEHVTDFVARIQRERSPRK
jgi:hypothetical protein